MNQFSEQVVVRVQALSQARLLVRPHRFPKQAQVKVSEHRAGFQVLQRAGFHSCRDHLLSLWLDRQSDVSPQSLICFGLVRTRRGPFLWSSSQAWSLIFCPSVTHSSHVPEYLIATKNTPGDMAI